MTVSREWRDEQDRRWANGIVDSVTDAELNRILGDDDTPAPAMPENAELEAHLQWGAAVERIHEDARNFARFPWPDLDDAAGAMVPEDLWIVAGRTGTGKSLFCQNLFDALIADKRAALYVGLEQKALTLRVKWACLRTGVSPRLVLAPKREEWGTPDHRHAQQLVQAEMRDYQQSDDVRRRAHFAPLRFVDRPRLAECCRWAKERDCQVVFVDHVDRIRHGEGKNPFAEMSATIRLAKELATDLRLVVVLASQVSRPTGDMLHMYLPPQAHELRGGGTKEEEADAILSVGRALNPGLTRKDFEDARRMTKAAAMATLYQPGMMEVQVLKHRLDGEVLRDCRLRVDRGRITERFSRTAS